jgi:DNA-binding PadR family transcriptional regulator
MVLVFCGIVKYVVDYVSFWETNMFLDERARVLELVSVESCGVRDVIQRLEWKASRVVSLLATMEGEGLVELRSMPAGKGRPKKAVVPTGLGLEFLEAYKRLETKPLRARRADLERAVRDALYVERLVAAGHSEFSLFMELNMIVRSVGESEETC